MEKVTERERGRERRFSKNGCSVERGGDRW